MEEVKELLGRVIKMTAVESEVQDNLFTPSHTKYDISLDIDGKPYECNFQCNPNYTKVSIDEILISLNMDASCYNGCIDIDDFALQFCPDQKVSEVIESYEACKKVSKYLAEVFGEDLERFVEMADNEFEAEFDRE